MRRRVLRLLYIPVSRVLGRVSTLLYRDPKTMKMRVSVFRTIVDDRTIVSDSTARFAAVLVVLASSVNPFVYTVLSKSFRKRPSQMCPCRLSCVVSETPELCLFIYCYFSLKFSLAQMRRSVDF